MSALPKSMDAADVAREHEASSLEQYYAHRQQQLSDAPSNAPLVDAAPRTPFFQFVERIRNSDRCPQCHKTRALIQLSTKDVSVREERPDPRIHCACPGGPAYAGIGSSITAPPTPKCGAFAIGTRVQARRRTLHLWEKGAPIEWIDAGTVGTITQLQGKLATISFDGHVQPYTHAIATLGDVVVALDRTDSGEDFPATDGGAR